MSYKRVIPRDLFNEAKLLKCMGQLALFVHEGKDDGKLRLKHSSPTKGFIVRQHEADGGLYVANISCQLADGRKVLLASNYNSKSSYPLGYNVENMEYGPVFNDDGTFSEEFLAILSGSGNDRP